MICDTYADITAKQVKKNCIKGMYRVCWRYEIEYAYGQQAAILLTFAWNDKTHDSCTNLFKADIDILAMRV